MHNEADQKRIAPKACPPRSYVLLLFRSYDRSMVVAQGQKHQNSLKYTFWTFILIYDTLIIIMLQ